MKRSDFYGMLGVIKQAKSLKHVDSQIALAQNKKKIIDDLGVVEEAFDHDGGYYEFDRKLVELGVKFAKKDDKGNTVKLFSNGQTSYDIGDVHAYNEAVNALRKEYADAIKAYNAKMNEVPEIKWSMIKKENIDDDNAHLVQDLLPFIEE